MAHRILDRLGRKVVARVDGRKLRGRLVRVGLIDGRPLDVSIRRTGRHRPRIVHLPVTALEALEVEPEAEPESADAAPDQPDSAPDQPEAASGA